MQRSTHLVKRIARAASAPAFPAASSGGAVCAGCGASVAAVFRPQQTSSSHRNYSSSSKTASIHPSSAASSTDSLAHAEDFFTSARFRQAGEVFRSSSHDEDDDRGGQGQYGEPGSSRGRGRGRLSDHEYQVRIGRAVQLLRATLPDFMSLGLADYPEPSTPTIMPLDPLALVRLAPTLRRSRRPQYLDQVRDEGAFGSIYHSDVLFEFMPSLGPPSADEDRRADDATHAASSGEASASAKENAGTSALHQSSSSNSAVSQDELEGRPSFSFSGRTLYLASAHVLRHALSAIFTNTHVSLDRLQLVRGRPAAQGEDFPGHSWNKGSHDQAPASLDREGATPLSSGDDELIARLTFSGVTRVMHQPHEYTVLFRYTLDRATGQIVRHRVERIQPEVGRSLWRGLSLAWFRLAPHMYPGSVVHAHHVAGAHTPTLRAYGGGNAGLAQTSDVHDSTIATMQHEGMLSLAALPVPLASMKLGHTRGLQRRYGR